MIEPKEKPCKGINKAKAYKGCGELTLYRTFGLCNNCLGDFLFGNDNGKLLMQKSIIPKAKSKVKKQEKEKTKKAKENLETKSSLERKMQQVINAIVREIDKGCNCISSQKPIPKGQEQAGHFMSRGSNPSLRFHLDNIFLQSVHDNMYKSGNQIGFLDGLRKEYGNSYAEYVLSLKSSLDGLNLSREEIKSATALARIELSRLKSLNLFMVDTKERLKLRAEINQKIGIYTTSSGHLNNLRK